MPTAIEWCDETFNPWWGCAEVSPGCGNCYARTWAAFTRAGLNLWPEKGAAGKGQEHAVMVTGAANWRKPLKWASELPEQLGRRPRIFCASMADVFEDLPALEEPRRRLFHLIADTPELDWLVLTKRPDYARDWLKGWYVGQYVDVVRAAAAGESRPEAAWDGAWPLPNVWMGVSIENARYTWRADVLREIPAAVRFISAEPLLGSLYPPEAWCKKCGHPMRGHGPGGCDWEVSDYGQMDCGCMVQGAKPLDLTGIDWTIIGGESGPGARPFHLEHAREIIRACIHQPMCALNPYATATAYVDAHPELCTCGSTAVFVKQFGARPVERGPLLPDGTPQREPRWISLRDRKHGGVMDEWPADLRIREFPRSAA